MKNDKLVILEVDNKDKQVSAEQKAKIDQLIREFKEELRPIGIACKNWAKC